MQFLTGFYYKQLRAPMQNRKPAADIYIIIHTKFPLNTIRYPIPFFFCMFPADRIHNYILNYLVDSIK